MATLVLAAVAAVRAPDPVSFPGSAEAKDPTGRFTVVAVAADARGATGYDLRLRVEKTGATRALVSFVRSALVFWSPDGNALAVTDRRSGERSTVLLFHPERPGTLDLDAELAKTLGPLPERDRNGHVYLEVVRWLNAKTLRVRLRGYGEHDPEGFDELFDYDLGGRFRRAAI
jgi:hypothetical protein